MTSTLRTSPPTKEFTATLHVPKIERLPTLTVPIGRYGRFEWTFFADHSSYSKMIVTCTNLYDEDPDWIIGARFRVTDPLDRERTLHHDFSSKKPNLEWSGQVKNDSAIKIVMVLDDNFKKFDVPDQFSDTCLKVGAEKFHVGKWLLINQSSHFKQLFEQGDLNEPVIILPEDHLLFFNDFLEFLLGERNINDNNIYCMMRLSQHYGCPLLTRECERFMSERSKRTAKDVYRLGNLFELPEVKKRAFVLIKNIEDLESFLPNDLQTFSKEEMIQLYYLSRKFNHAKVSLNRVADQQRERLHHELLRGMRERFQNVMLDAAQRHEEHHGHLDPMEWPARFGPGQNEVLGRVRMLIETREEELRNAPFPPGILNERGRAQHGAFRGIALGRNPAGHRLVWFENDEDARTAEGLLERGVRIVVGRGEQLRLYAPPPPPGRREPEQQGDHVPDPREWPVYYGPGPDEGLERLRMFFELQREELRNTGPPLGVLNERGRFNRGEYRGIAFGRLPLGDGRRGHLVWFENDDDARATVAFLAHDVAVVILSREPLQIQLLPPSPDRPGPMEGPHHFGPDHMDRIRMHFEARREERRNLMDERGAQRGGHRGPPRQGNERMLQNIHIRQRIETVQDQDRRNAPFPPGILNERGRAHREEFRGIPLGRLPAHRDRDQLFHNPETEPPLVWFENEVDARAAEGFLEENVALVIGPSEQFRVQLPGRRAHRRDHRGEIRPPRPGMEPPPVMFENHDDMAAAARDILLEPRQLNQGQQPLDPVDPVDDNGEEEYRRALEEARQMLDERLARRGGHGGPRGRGHYGPPRPGMEPPLVVYENNDDAIAAEQWRLFQYRFGPENREPQPPPDDVLGPVEGLPRNANDNGEEIFRRDSDRMRMQTDALREERMINEQGARRGGHRGVPRGGPRGRGQHGSPRPGMEPAAERSGDILLEPSQQNRGQQPPPLFIDDRMRQQIIDRINELERMQMQDAGRGEPISLFNERGDRGGGHRGMPRGGHRGRGHHGPPRPGMEPAAERAGDNLFEHGQGPPAGGAGDQ